MQSLGLGSRAARTMEIFEQLARFTDAERLRRRSRTENFECTFAGIAMGTGDPMKLSVGNVGGGLQRAENDRPADLQRAQIALGKCSSSTIEGCDRKLVAGQAAQIVSEQLNFLQLRRRRCDRFTNVRKREKFRLVGASVLPKRLFG